jgi:hypothetical protein
VALRGAMWLLNSDSPNMSTPIFTCFSPEHAFQFWCLIDDDLVPGLSLRCEPRSQSLIAMLIRQPCAPFWVSDVTRICNNPC